DLAAHLADRHLAVALVRVLPGQHERIPHARHADTVDAKERAVELGGVGAVDSPDVAVLERQVQVATPGGIRHPTRAGGDDAAALGVFQVVNRHVLELVRVRVDVRGPQEELLRHDLVDHLLLERERGLLALNVHLQGAQAVIGAREHLVVPGERQRADERRADEHRRDDPPGADPARRQRGDLVVRREPRERVQHRDEHRHRERHRDDERDREDEDLDDDAPGEPLADQVPELLRDLLEEHQTRQSCQREAERREMLAQEVPGQGAHGRSRHYIRNSKSLQGMRRPTEAGLLALSLVIPQAHGQDAGAPAGPGRPPTLVATFHWAPIAPPRSAALLPGGRLGPHSTPAVVAAAWEQRMRALLPPPPPGALAEPLAAPPAPPPSPPPPPPPPPVRPIRLLGAPPALRLDLSVRFELKAAPLPHP